MRKRMTICLTVVCALNMVLLGCSNQSAELKPTFHRPEDSLASETTAHPATEPITTTSCIETEGISRDPDIVFSDSTVMEVIEPTSTSNELKDNALVRVRDYIPEIQQDLIYATVNNFTEQRIYDFTDAYLRYGTVKKLKEANEMLNDQGLGLKIWDAFRPVVAQAKLYDANSDPNVVSHPVTGYRGHCRGNAVDVTLVDLATGLELPMPTGFDDFTAFADRDYSDCEPEIAQNAMILEETMTRYGFKPLKSEWWHFSDTETYPVEEAFTPGTPTMLQVSESEPNEEHTSLSFCLNGSDVTKDAVLYTGDGYSIFIFADEWEHQSEMIDGYPTDVWKNDADTSVKLCVVKLDGTSLDDGHAWVKTQFPEYELLEDSREGLGGSDVDGNMMDVWFYVSEEAVYAVFQMYPLNATETPGVYLGVMVDTFKVLK